MKFRIKEVMEDRWFHYLKQWHRIPVYYPQYKRFLFWRNFREWCRGPKWRSQITPSFKYKEDAEAFLRTKTL